MKLTRSALCALALGALLSCSAHSTSQRSASAGNASGEFELSLARAPYDAVEVNWKHRLDQPYVFVEARGAYTQVGRVLEVLFAAAREQALDAAGPPFALYYDDPGQTAVSELRLRACLPVAAGAPAQAPLSYDVLPSTTVVYAYVAGPYPDAPQAYPALYAYLRRMNWVENGPIREVYLRSPASVTSWEELVCEIQLPAGLSR